MHVYTWYITIIPSPIPTPLHVMKIQWSLNVASMLEIWTMTMKKKIQPVEMPAWNTLSNVLAYRWLSLVRQSLLFLLSKKRCYLSVVYGMLCNKDAYISLATVTKHIIRSPWREQINSVSLFYVVMLQYTTSHLMWPGPNTAYQWLARHCSTF